MREFFNGWRRKVGRITLVMVCVFAGVWVRSLFRYESIAFYEGDVVYGVTSKHGGLDLSRETFLDRAQASFIDYQSHELPINPQDPFEKTPWPSGFAFRQRCDWAGFHIGVSLGKPRCSRYFVPGLGSSNTMLRAVSWPYLPSRTPKSCFRWSNAAT